MVSEQIPPVSKVTKSESSLNLETRIEHVDGDNIEDRIGAVVRVGERAAFRAQKTAGRVVRRASPVVNGFNGRVF